MNQDRLFLMAAIAAIVVLTALPLAAEQHARAVEASYDAGPTLTPAQFEAAWALYYARHPEHQPVRKEHARGCPASESAGTLP